MSNKLNILIIGGSSFVAKNFIRLQHLNYNIKTVSRANIHFENELVIADFFNIESEHLKNVDIVINCAAIVHQQGKIDEKVYFKINKDLPLKIAEKAKNAGVKTFIQLSTIAVYGKQTHISLKTLETPTTPYGKSKLAADQDLLKLKSNDFNVVILRPPMIYGGDNPPGNMMKLIRLISKNLPLPFKGIKNKRDFIHIDNLIGFIDAAIQINQSEIYLISDNTPINIEELYIAITQSLSIKNKAYQLPSFFLNFMKMIIPNIYDKLFGNLTLDITDTLTQLNFKPQPLFLKGIDEMVESLKKEN
ncbi:MAG: NAD-dependent epimerase/dehydratase family protein [Flavobacteriales bacterium]|nr:NAD-dependent epimerase/dehydratase family protein [Flavobacteriales bacterium]